MPSYTAVGGIKLRGCAPVAVDRCYTYKYVEGSAVYVCRKAAKGVLEKVVVKRAVLRLGEDTYNQPLFVYVDTLNEVWMEEELCTQRDAVAAATAYYERQQTLNAAAISRALCATDQEEM